ncbi:MAG: hypothetical protein K8R02_04045 [Anaerohalosphaeraceae bacterium]|nr:hypothetical protein [Anaerohalosphaeraceae bacterium]
MRKLIVVSTVCCLLTLGSMAKAGDGIEFEITSDFYSKYVWRGQQLNDDYVFQTGVSASYKGLTAAIWGNLDLTEFGNNRGEFTEFDYSLDYSGTIGEEGKVGYSVGLINYHFPSIIGDTTEFYWGFSFDVFLQPYVTVYHDIDVVDGIYVNAGISHSFAEAIKLTESLSADLDLGLSLGWADSKYNKAYWDVDEATFNDLLFTVALPIDLGSGWTVTPSFNYSFIVSDSIRNSANFNGDSDSFYTGISIAKSF